MIQAPQVRDEPETYRSRLMTFLRGNSDVLERLTVEMYAQGLSMRDIEETLEEVADWPLPGFTPWRLTR